MEKFLWGAATSSHQIEGHNVNNDWWDWEQKGHIEGGVKSGAAIDHWHRWRHDLELARDLGLTSYRFSIEWSRIEPEPDQWNQEALNWYRDLINECGRLGIMPMVTLHHFTLPRWLAERGGFAWDQSPAHFLRYVEKVVESLGSIVPLWCTLNEPMVLTVGGYLAQFMPPGHLAPELASQVCHNLLKSHVMAYDHIHAHGQNRTGPWAHIPLQVGLAHNVMDFHADRPWNAADQCLRYFAHRFYNRAWLDAITGRKTKFAIPFVMPQAPVVSEAVGRRSTDFIGLNYYTKGYVQWRPRSFKTERAPEFPFDLQLARRRERTSDMGWAIHPQGFAKMIKFVASYGLPIYITENGVADRQDHIRPQFLTEHLTVLAELGPEVDLRGYYHWSLFDNFEWIKGFSPRFGLYSVNYETFERTLTKSGALYRKIIRLHGDGRPRKEVIAMASTT